MSPPVYDKRVEARGRSYSPVPSRSFKNTKKKKYYPFFNASRFQRPFRPHPSSHPRKPSFDFAVNALSTGIAAAFPHHPRQSGNSLFHKHSSSSFRTNSSPNPSLSNSNAHKVHRNTNQERGKRRYPNIMPVRSKFQDYCLPKSMSTVEASSVSSGDFGDTLYEVTDSYVSENEPQECSIPSTGLASMADSNPAIKLSIANEMPDHISISSKESSKSPTESESHSKKSFKELSSPLESLATAPTSMSTQSNSKGESNSEVPGISATFGTSSVVSGNTVSSFATATNSGVNSEVSESNNRNIKKSASVKQNSKDSIELPSKFATKKKKNMLSGTNKPSEGLNKTLKKTQKMQKGQGLKKTKTRPSPQKFLPPIPLIGETQPPTVHSAESAKEFVLSQLVADVMSTHSMPFSPTLDTNQAALPLLELNVLRQLSGLDFPGHESSTGTPLSSNPTSNNINTSPLSATNSDIRTNDVILTQVLPSVSTQLSASRHSSSSANENESTTSNPKLKVSQTFFSICTYICSL